MDFTDERDEEMERSAVLEIDGISVEIPEELVSEGMELMCSPRETVLDMWKAPVSSRYGDFLREESEKPGFDKEVAEFLNNDLDFYRPTKEMERNIVLEIDGIAVEIPKGMIEKRMELMHFTRQEALNDVMRLGRRYCRHLQKIDTPKDKYPEEIIKYLQAEAETYR